MFKKSILTSSILLAMSSAQSAIIFAGASSSLQDAISAANTDAIVGSCIAGNGDDVIELDPSIDQFFANPSLAVPSVAEPGTQVGYPIIETHITINGSNSLIQGSTSDNLRLFEVNSIGTLSLNNVRLERADDGAGRGSAVFNDGGDLILNQVTVSNTHGGIRNKNGVLEINDSTLVGNFVESNNAAALYASDSLVTVNNSAVINNYDRDVPPQILRSRNPVSVLGGTQQAAGIHLHNSNTTLTNVTISGNRGNFVGGISVSDNLIAPAALEEQTNKSGNKVGYGNSLTLNHVTLSNNLGGVVGGLISFGGATHTLFQGNIITGNLGYSQPELNNMYFAANPNLTANAHNFIGANGQSGVTGITFGGNDHVFAGSTEDNLYPLTLSNGQFVHPLKHGSVVIDGLAKSCYGGVFTDQEGKGRGIDGDANGSFICDAGAFEHSLPIVLNDGACNLSNAIISANNDASVGGCQPGNGHDILVLPENSTHSATDIAEIYDFQGLLQFSMGFPVIKEGLVIEANGSTIERSISAVSAFDLIAVEAHQGLILNDAIVTGASGDIAALSSFYQAELQVFDSIIAANQSTGIALLGGKNSGVYRSTISTNNNPAALAHFPGGIAIGGSHVSIEQNAIVGNSGGYSGGVFGARFLVW